MDEFKFICWMEYAHRMWGRALGFVFAVPAAYFGVRGYINPALAKSLGLFFLMGGTQGLVGWWMVKSGLQVCFLASAAFHPGLCSRLQSICMHLFKVAAKVCSSFCQACQLPPTILPLSQPAMMDCLSSCTGSSLALQCSKSLRISDKRLMIMSCEYSASSMGVCGRSPRLSGTPPE